VVKQRPYTVSGLLVGGLLGAVCRPAVVFAFWLIRNDPPVAGEMILIIVLIAGAIGFGIGSCASLVASLVASVPTRAFLVASSRANASNFTYLVGSGQDFGQETRV
jgi:hypothetical protein